MERPVCWSAVKISVTVAFGAASLSTANEPVTCGVAIEVPLAVAQSAPGYEDWIDVPGASKDRKEATFENDDTASVFVVEPTLTAVETQPGELMAFVKPPFPAATTVAMRTERRLSMMAFVGSWSQFAVYFPPPRLMFTDAIVY